MCNDDIDVNYSVNKCPETSILLNGVPICALLDSASQVNAISEQWFQNTKRHLGSVVTLRLCNTVIKGATGIKSKKVTQQVWLTARIGEVEVDSAFVVIPELVRDCICLLYTSH